MQPNPPDPHPNLSPDLNTQVAHTLIEGGADLRQIPKGGALVVTTLNTVYRVERRTDGETNHPFRISGHRRICPQPRRANIIGSSWGGPMLRPHFVGRGMCMEVCLENEGRKYTPPPLQLECM